MNNENCISDTPSWRDMYRLTILERDHNAIPDRIAETRTLINRRAHDLFYSADVSLDEKEALADAIYALKALEESLKHRDRRLLGDVERLITAA